MKIDEIYVVATRSDIRFGRACIASIRYFHPDIPIRLLKDEIFGAFDTRELERHFQVETVQAPQRIWGWGFAKFYPLMLPPGRRVLILDSDILFTHPLLQRLEQYDEDFIVASEPDWPDYEDYVRRAYFVADKLEAFSPGFERRLTFNGGQVVANTGLLTREDFEHYVEFSEPVTVKRPDVFPCGEQGITNHLVNLKLARGEITARALDFMLWADSPRLPHDLPARDGGADGIESYMLAHYTSHKKIYPWKMKGKALYTAFEDLYYHQLPLGWLLERWRFLQPLTAHQKLSLKQRIKKILQALRA
ncbi:hypothetical protein H5P28_10915 [Ruficoccus amylovorans]|uniref:Glycosyl transferase family 8 n=1 Tax=Ruficoccus amylovorans TaxID=1804625 RepID=A0A842HEB5_9BACT|nr:hypothetical protein [Ruficoccus amylovorans]MBC2594772.1 hypothetical protein [Ruficoccus amylovorans]